MNQNPDPAQVPYPPAPWRSAGRFWMGLFKTDVPVQPPAPLKNILNPRWVVVALIRYLEGTLRYDELAINGLVRLGGRPGLFVHHIWVDDAASLWGGRNIWGMPKQMGDFAWEDNTVRITDAQGLVATMTVDRSEGRLPKIWSPIAGLHDLDGRWAYSTASMWARPGKCKMRVTEWPERHPYRLGETPMIGFAAKPFRMVVNGAKPIRK